MSNKKYYKGFNKDMTCRGFQFSEGETYEEPEAILCSRGFHACEAPLDTFFYYDPRHSVYHEVELDDVSDERHSDDSKVVSKKITVGARLDMVELCKAQFDFVKSNTTFEITDLEAATAGIYGAATADHGGAATAGGCGVATAGDGGAATAGEYGAATAGDYGAATAGNRGAATAGDRGAATAGDRGAATAGKYGAATAGGCGVATAGDGGAATAGEYGAATAGGCGAATAGKYGAATAGNSGAATSKGSAEVGENGIACVRGNDVKACGGLGAILVIAVENVDNYEINAWKAFVVDGEKVKVNTWYTLENGKLVEFLDEKKEKQQ